MLYFNKFPSFTVNENVIYDKSSDVYHRSFAHIIIDNLNTVGGMVEYGEISYIAQKASTEDKEILNKSHEN